VPGDDNALPGCTRSGSAPGEARCHLRHVKPGSLAMTSLDSPSSDIPVMEPDSTSSPARSATRAGTSRAPAIAGAPRAHAHQPPEASSAPKTSGSTWRLYSHGSRSVGRKLRAPTSCTTLTGSAFATGEWVRRGDRQHENASRAATRQAFGDRAHLGEHPLSRPELDYYAGRLAPRRLFEAPACRGPSSDHPGFRTATS